MHNRRPAFLLLAIVALQPTVAHAYIGPGVGAGAIAAVLGVLASIFLALFAVIYYPVKRMVKRRKSASETSGKDPKA
jgi:membrane protein implicated in regulation of membrane protease activity